MPVSVCPKGHDSSETDFCSVCGSKLQAGREAEACPDCGTARDASGGIFCETCGYNFNTATHGLPKAAQAQPDANHVWQIEIAVDPSLRSDESPEPPLNFVAATVELAKESSLIGRLSEKRGVFPDVALNLDEAVSHRHALLNKLPDGGLIVRDIGSSNGTRLNGTDLQPLTDTPLHAGDQLTLGHWTRLTIK